MAKKKKSNMLGLFFKEPVKEVSKENPLIDGKTVNPKNGIKKHFVVIESMTSGLEKHYFWALRFLREPTDHGLGFDKVEKIKDLFDASVTSSFHGHVGQKLSVIQQQAQQYLGLVSGMVKNFFPMLREMRQLDERLTYYHKSAEGDESAEVALKSIWVEVVEQGVQNPNSIYGLAQKVGFITLPDYFFSVNPKNELDGVDKAIKSLEKYGINRKNADVLRKKLFQYYNWKKNTYNELKTRRDFMLKQIRQHYNAIKIYTNWLRPYFKTIKQLQMKNDFNDADMVSAFETSKIELELLAYKTEGYKMYHPVLLIKLTHVTRPELIYTPQGQKQPIHVGRTEMIIEPYVASMEEIERYKKQQDLDDLDLFASIDSNMAVLKDDLLKYLKEAGEDVSQLEQDWKTKEKEGVKKRPSANPFKALADGFSDMFSMVIPKFNKKTPKQEAYKIADAKKKAEKEAALRAYILYDVFKKVNGLYSIVNA